MSKTEIDNTATLEGCDRQSKIVDFILVHPQVLIYLHRPSMARIWEQTLRERETGKTGKVRQGACECDSEKEGKTGYPIQTQYHVTTPKKGSQSEVYALKNCKPRNTHETNLLLRSDRVPPRSTRRNNRCVCSHIVALEKGWFCFGFVLV